MLHNLNMRLGLMTVIQLPRWRSVSKRVGGVVYQSQDWNTQGGDVVYQNNLKGGVVYQKNPLLCPDDDRLRVTEVTRLPCSAFQQSRGVVWVWDSMIMLVKVHLLSFTKKKYCATMNWAERLLEVSSDWWSPGEESGEAGVFYWSR